MRAQVALLVCLPLLAGCMENKDCSSSYPDGELLQLSCTPRALRSVQLTGACASAAYDAASDYLSDDLGGPNGDLLSIHSNAEGDCHITIVFDDGFTWSGDVHFTLHTNQCAGVFSGTPSPLRVNNPPDTCVGWDAGASG